MSTFAQRLSRFRETNHLSQTEAGKLLGVTGQYCGMLERGEKEVSEDSTISRLLKLYESNGIPNSLQPRQLLKQARLKKGLSIKELAKLTGYQIGVHQAVEDGTTQASEGFIDAVCRVLPLSKEELMGGSETPLSRHPIKGTHGAKPDIIPLDGTKVKLVPLISFAQAGAMGSYEDVYTHEGTVAFNCTDPKAFALTLVGESMQPVYGEGDIILLYPLSLPRNGNLVVARTTFDDVMFKIYSSSNGGKNVTLTSYNPLYPKLEYTADQFRWIYPVAAVTKKLMEPEPS